jgi:hypothetical protein
LNFCHASKSAAGGEPACRAAAAADYRRGPGFDQAKRRHSSAGFGGIVEERVGERSLLMFFCSPIQLFHDVRQADTVSQRNALFVVSRFRSK